MFCSYASNVADYNLSLEEMCIGKLVYPPKLKTKQKLTVPYLLVSTV